MEHLTPGLGTLPHPPQFRVLRLIMAAGAAAAGLCLVLAMLALATSFGKTNIGDTGNYRTGGSGAGQQNDLNGIIPQAHSGGHHRGHHGQPGSGKRGTGKGQAHSSSPSPHRSKHKPARTATPAPSPSPAPTASQPGTGQPGGPQPGSTVASFQGSTSADEGPFHIRQPGQWGVSWSFRCPAGRSEDFSVSEVAGHSGKTPPGKKGSSLQIDTSGPSGSGLTWQSHDVGSHFLKIVSGCSWTIKVVLPKSG